jgi:GNAT acetyltransferase-like protein
MNFVLLRAAKAQEHDRWLQFWRALPKERRDVYFLPEYLAASETARLGTAACAVASHERAIWLYPFLMCDTPLDAGGARYVDLITAYGYGGPVVSLDGEDESFLNDAWAVFGEWAAAAQVVGEFVRFHPLLGNSRWAAPETRVVRDRRTISIDVASYPYSFLNDSYYRVHRHMVRRAEREGFVFDTREPAAAMEWFIPLYNETQEFLNAGNDTRFDDVYFESLVAGLGDRAWLGVVTQEEHVVAAVLVLDGDPTSHCHLMGYRRLTKTAGMTNLIYHGITLEAARRGTSAVHMGGGRTGNDDDSLFKFKASLSPHQATFEIGMRCHDSPVYERLGRDWEKTHGPKPRDYFLYYRLPGPKRSSISSSSS